MSLVTTEDPHTLQEALHELRQMEKVGKPHSLFLCPH